MKDCQGELLGRVRRGLASAQEQTAFEAHLSSCESCRMTFDLMSDFDVVGEAAPGDLERVAAMAGAAAAAHGKGAPAASRTSHRTWRLTLAALVMTGAAAAGVAVRLAPDPQSKVEAPRSTDTGTVARSATASSASKKPADSAVETNTETSPRIVDAPPSAPNKDNSQRGAPGAGASAPSSSSSAKDAYRAANDARRAGRTGAAIQGYQRLQRDFPSSPETRASRVSLGGLLMRTGSSSAALAQFDAYLASPGGQLAAEALYGRAQALRALGRSAEEAQNLDRLVRTYPNSAYATHAQRRLLEIR